MAGLDDAAGKKEVDEYCGLNLALHNGTLEAAGSRALQQEYKGLVVRMRLSRVEILSLGGGLAVSNK